MLRESQNYNSPAAVAISNRWRLTTTLLALPISLMIAVICIGQAQAQSVLPSRFVKSDFINEKLDARYRLEAQATAEEDVAIVSRSDPRILRETENPPTTPRSGRGHGRHYPGGLLNNVASVRGGRCKSNAYEKKDAEAYCKKALKCSEKTPPEVLTMLAGSKPRRWVFVCV